MDESPVADGPLPEAATRRLTGAAFTSALSVSDFAAVEALGLQPVGFVQGYCVMQWQNYAMNSPLGFMGQGLGQATTGYNETFSCPHGFVSNDHRSWGQNFEQVWMEDAWSQGFGDAYSRMLDEARDLGAHGVVGVHDSTERLSEAGLVEFRVQGTAVTILDAPPLGDDAPWTTYLAGQRLHKLIEAGYAPVSIAATVSSVRVWAYCMTEYLSEGSIGMFSGISQGTEEIVQTAGAQTAARRIARERVRAQLGGDTLHGATMMAGEYEFGHGDAEYQCTLRGNRVRRFRDFEALAAPRPMVRLR